jgi:hypothetical protein
MKHVINKMKNIEEIARIIFFNPDKAEEIIELDRVSDVIKEIGDRIQEYNLKLKDEEDSYRLSAILEDVAHLDNLRKVLID